MKHNFDRKHNVQVDMSLFPGTPVMVQKREADISTYSIMVDVPECTVHEGHCCKINFSSGRIITRNSIHVYHVHAKTFLTAQTKRLNLNLTLYNT